jgi:hypothetical protein
MDLEVRGLTKVLGHVLGCAALFAGTALVTTFRRDVA